jgi:hypothetical protein
MKRESSWPERQAKASGRKRFFFEKKNQKTFANLASVYPEEPQPTIKSFLLLFFKKEGLASFLSDLS